MKKLIASSPEKEGVFLLPIALELDEQWSFVGSKSNQRWLWLAISHHTSEILAYTFGGRTDAVLQELKRLLEPFNITKYFTDGLLAYQRLLSHEKHEEGKRNTQKIERKFLTLTVSSLKEMCENRFETPPCLFTLLIGGVLLTTEQVENK